MFGNTYIQKKSTLIAENFNSYEMWLMGNCLKICQLATS